MQQRAGSRPGNFVERASQEKSATMAANSADGSSKDLAESGSAGPPRKKTNSPTLEDAAASVAQMAPFQSALIPGHPIQQTDAAALPHMETLLQEKGVLTAALPDSASQLAGSQGQTDLAATPASRAAVRTPSNPGAGREGIDTKEALAGSESSQSHDPNLSASAPALLKRQIASGGQMEDNPDWNCRRVGIQLPLRLRQFRMPARRRSQERGHPLPRSHWRLRSHRTCFPRSRLAPEQRRGSAVAIAPRKPATVARDLNRLRLQKAARSMPLPATRLSQPRVSIRRIQLPFRKFPVMRIGLPR